ncbi:MAG: ABC transporter substrate-binding protein [Thermodesulfobacteriota bacterium]
MKIRKRVIIGGFAICLLVFASTASALEGKLTVAPTCWGSGVLDPHQITTGCEIVTTGLVMFNGLLQRGQKGTIEPVLATDWKMSKDGLSYTFTLRNDVKFHNGDSFTAEDVKFSFDRILSDEVKSIRKPTIAMYLSRTEVVNPYQVKIYLKKPFPSIEERVGDYMLIMPKKYYEKVGKKGFEEAPVGTGPWKFVKREQNDALYFTANESYFKEGPYIKDLVYRNIPEEATKWAALKNGEIDAAYFTALPYLSEAKASKEFKIITIPNTATFSLWPRLDKPVDKLDAETKPLADARVRRAITMAIDRKTLIASTLYGYGAVMKYMVCPNERGYRASDQPIPYDPKGAKRLLAQAGYPNGFTTRINTTNNDIAKLQAQFIQAQLAEVGIRVTLEVMDLGTLYKRGFGTFDLSGFSTGGWYTGTHFEPWGWKGLVDPFKGPAWDDLQILYTEVVSAYKIADRQRIADKIRDIYIKEIPVIPLAVLHWPWVIRAKIVEWPYLPAYDLISSSHLVKLKK